MTHFEDPPWEDLPSLGSGWVWDGDLVVNITGGEGEGTGNTMYNKVTINLNSKLNKDSNKSKKNILAMKIIKMGKISAFI